MSETWSLVARFVLGGSVVASFAALAEVFEPKTFSGTFAAAPTVAAVSLAFAFHRQGADSVAPLTTAMLFGGAAALIGKALGPNAGGLFLAFPAILPASITLVKKHDGRAQAVDDARGARLGALALICFALVTLTLHRHGAALSLLAAVLTWFAAAFLLWFLVYGRGRQ